MGKKLSEVQGFLYYRSSSLSADHVFSVIASLLMAFVNTKTKVAITGVPGKRFSLIPDLSTVLLSIAIILAIGLCRCWQINISFQSL